MKQTRKGRAAGSASREATLAALLKGWFRKSARDLPWRRTRDPYAIWLSEVMLQQTRVETVIPYYERFLQRFPDVRALASAELDEVLSLWSGLGYYRRARELHRCAQEVASIHGGVFPAEAEELRKLRGIGPYTAGAVSSIAFDRPAALVDGNVARVLARLEVIEDDVKSTAGLKRIWSVAEKLVPQEEPGAWNQALMELGATICTPQNPACLICPVRDACAARAQGRERELPIVGEKKASPRVAMVAVVVEHEGRFLFARRKDGGLFGGLWEPPMVEARSAEDAKSSLRGAGVAAEAKLTEVGRVEHVLTHRELDVLVLRARADRPWPLETPTTAPYERLAWLERSAEGVGVSTLARKILAAAKPEKKGAARKKKARA
ncbi:A/G-specific adenine glycosylase [Polyangium sp. 15x6]|uniref:A/G-specific adenine glycosylase n=1 Tax=Polyangium sp. 15x6 TaxID=3042687 RepID=UPI00249ABCD7|nr:A/G-specific adenine glycosylase [Polyangium sp. 15x6]MDI3286308.1 A/G-specific adenine glycosylase [Polyangium sp. 15x6]